MRGIYNAQLGGDLIRYQIFSDNIYCPFKYDTLGPPVCRYKFERYCRDISIAYNNPRNLNIPLV